MSTETIRPIATEWYRPEGRSFETNFQLGRVMAGFFGEDAIRLCRGLAAGTTLSKEEAEAMDVRFLESSRKIYNLPDRVDPQQFYLQQNKGAIEAIQYFGRLVPELAADFELKDEAIRLSERPSDLLELLASQPPNIDPRLAYEVRRHAVLIYQLGMINARTLNVKLQTVLSDVQSILNDKLYEGPLGYGERISWESFHDDETNEVVGFPDHNDRKPLTAHLKRMSFGVRRIRDVGIVYTNDRKKDDTVAIVKSWVKALRNSGTIHMDDAVQDSIGMTFVLMEGDATPEQLADLVVSVIKAGIESRIEFNHRRQLPNIASVETDDVVDGDHGQACKASFDARRKIWLEGIPTPIEVMFSGRETHLNYRLEVGTRNPETGLYEGRGHPLFELRRGREAVRVPFPKEIYPVDDHILNTAFVSRSKQIAYGLRGMHKAT